VLFGVQPYDVTLLATAAVPLAACVGLASYLPARRATKVDPAVTLRCE
jgi:ABC-type lipoprotein release transport system permease subunit